MPDDEIEVPSLREELRTALASLLRRVLEGIFSADMVVIADAYFIVRGIDKAAGGGVVGVWVSMMVILLGVAITFNRHPLRTMAYGATAFAGLTIAAYIAYIAGFAA